MKEKCLSFRIATKEDIDFLCMLRKNTMEEHLKAVGSLIDDKNMLERVNYKYKDAKIIRLDSRDVGLLKVDKSSNPWELVQIQLLPELQGEGIGAKLVRDILVEAKLYKVDVSLSVLKGNPARNLYERLGFQVYKEEDIAYKMRWFNE